MNKTISILYRVVKESYIHNREEIFSSNRRHKTSELVLNRYLHHQFICLIHRLSKLPTNLCMLQYKPLKNLLLVALLLTAITRSLCTVLLVVFNIATSKPKNLSKCLEKKYILDLNSPPLFDTTRRGSKLVFNNNIEEFLLKYQERDITIITKNKIVSWSSGKIAKHEKSRQWYLQLCSRQEIPSLLVSTLKELYKTAIKLQKVSTLTLTYEILAERIRKDLNIDLVVDSCNLSQIHYEQLSETSRDKIKIICLSHNIPYKKEVFAEKNKVRYLHEIWNTDIAATEWYLISKTSERYVKNYMVASGLETRVKSYTLVESYSRHKLEESLDTKLCYDTSKYPKTTVLVFDNPVKNEKEIMRAFYHDQDVVNIMQSTIKPSYLIEFWRDLLSIKSNHYIWKPKRDFIPGTVLHPEYDKLLSTLYSCPSITVANPLAAPADLARTFDSIPIVAFPFSSSILPNSPIYRRRSIYYCPESMYKSDLDLDTMIEVELIVGKTALERRLSNHFMSKN